MLKCTISVIDSKDRRSQEIILHYLRNPQMSIDDHRFPILSEEGNPCFLVINKRIDEQTICF